jgi:hypothetical protein
MRPPPALPFLAVLPLLLAGCIHRYYTAEATELEAPSEDVTVQSPLRVHLADGGVVLFRGGGIVSPDRISGTGVRYDLARTDSVRVRDVDMDSVVGIESFRRELEAGKSVAVSVAANVIATVVTVGGLVAIACAADPKCFGSCPTVYSHGPDGEVLEAELFSYSIAPLLEGRDVDVLGARAGQDGVLRLEVRNEAMETHFINHLQLLEVRHGAGERVAPDVDGHPVAWRDARTPARAADGAGRPVLDDIAAADGRVFASSPARLASAAADRLDDHLELVFPAPAADSAVLVRDGRNSLLNTVLFYDLMLGGAGARALDWMADDLQRIGEAVKLGRWWVQRMGLHVSVLDDDGWRPVVRVPDTGPIAWTHVAIPVPVPAGQDSLRVRLRFPVDAWRIDRVALADFRRPEPRTLPAARVLDGNGVARDSALQAVAAPNDRYIQTVAGDRFRLEFDVGPEPDTGHRTFLLSSQGYYTEWVRPAWIRDAGSQQAFVPSDQGLLEAMRRWHAVRDEYEQRFYETRIPVR